MKAVLSLAQMDVLEWITKYGPTAPVVLHGGVVKALVRRGLVQYDEQNRLVLTDAGRKHNEGSY